MTSSSSFFTDLLKVEDRSNTVPREVLDAINYNMEMLALTLQGKLTGQNIAEDSIGDEAIENSDLWNAVYDGTLTYRTEGAPENDPVPSGIDKEMTASGNLDITLYWNAYVQGDEKPADMLILFWKKGSAPGLSAPEINDPNIIFSVNEGLAHYTFHGLASEKYYSFGMAAIRKTEKGLEMSNIVSPTTTPDWQDVTQGTPDYVGAIDGTLASEVLTTLEAKKRNFTTTPTPPYEVGDLWSAGDAGDLKKCVEAKTGDSYYYYEEGTENIVFDVGYSDGDGSQSKEEGYLLLIGTDMGGVRTYVTTSAIDLTNISTLKIDWEGITLSGATGVAKVAISTDKNSDYTVSDADVILLADFARVLTSIDVSSLEGSYYIKIHSIGIFAGDSYQVKVYNIEEVSEYNANDWELASKYTDDTNANLALSGTVNYRTTGAPTNNPIPTAIDVDMNTDGSIDAKLSWGAYTQGDKQADMLMLFWKKGTTTGLGAPTVDDSCIVFNVNTAGASYYTFEGLASDKYYSFGIAAARRTESGLEVSTIQSPTSAPNWQDVTEGSPDFNGNIGDEGTVYAKGGLWIANPKTLESYVYFSTPTANPYGLTHDGTYLWHVENTNDKIYRITEAGVATLMFDCPADDPRGLTWDGTYFWHSDMGTGTIYKINTSGVVQSSFGAPGGTTHDLAWDGTYLWNACLDTVKIYKLNTSGVAQSNFNSPGSFPFGLTFDGTYLWHSDMANTIYKLGVAGAVYGTFDTTSIDTSPLGLAYDEPYLWCVGGTNDRIYKLGAYDYKLIANT